MSGQKQVATHLPDEIVAMIDAQCGGPADTRNGRAGGRSRWLKEAVYLRLGLPLEATDEDPHQNLGEARRNRPNLNHPAGRNARIWLATRGFQSRGMGVELSGAAAGTNLSRFLDAFGKVSDDLEFRCGPEETPNLHRPGEEFSSAECVVIELQDWIEIPDPPDPRQPHEEVFKARFEPGFYLVRGLSARAVVNVMGYRPFGLASPDLRR